jgi:arylsulfatase A-like enzyme
MRGARRRAVLLTALLASAAGCTSSRSRPSILLITLDTTRSDRVGTYGDPSARTPEFDALARQGVLFRDAFVGTSTTLPSHTTMMTGAVELRHGVRLNGAFALAGEARTLAEMLREDGFRTAAVVSSAALAAQYGLDQGFERFDDAMPDSYPHFDPALAVRARRLAGNQRRAQRTTAAALDVLTGLQTPAFLWVHYVDAHQPDDPPPPWNRIPRLPLYSAEIAQVDREMGRLMRAFEADQGQAVVAVLADHGENLGEHREHGHRLFLSDAILHIPFAVRAPDVPARLACGVATNADVAPTLAVLAGSEDATFPDGTDLLAAKLRDDRPVFAETLAPSQSLGGAAVKAMRLGSWKYVLAPRPEVYELERDPGETDNVFGENAAVQSRLSAALVEVVERVLTAPEYPRALPLRLDERSRERLAALGYVSDADPDVSNELAPRGLDPKDIVDVVQALEAVDDGLMELARPRLERFWREHPVPRDSTWHELFARAHFCQAALDWTDGQAAAAVVHLREALRLDPDHGDARLLLEQAERDARRSDR